MHRRMAKPERVPLPPPATCRQSRLGRNHTEAFLVPNNTWEFRVSMRKQPDHWWTQFRSSRSERRQPSPESQQRLFGPVNETCQRILGKSQYKFWITTGLVQ
jgi:hypothetical protein